MTPEQIIENNRLIANFMEYPGDGKGMYFNPSDDILEVELVSPGELPYHKSWDWLMPVVDKIESLIIDNDTFYEVRILGQNWVIVSSSHGDEMIVSEMEPTKILCVYYAVVEFIKWYNQNHKQ